MDTDHHAASGRLGCRNIADLWSGADDVEDHCSHGRAPLGGAKETIRSGDAIT
jgi:hypothetical protein